MFSAFRIFEIVLFALINFAPYVLLSLYTFHGQMRFSKVTTGITCLLLMAIQFATRYWSATRNLSSSVLMSIVRLVIFLAVYAILFDVRFRKILFIELIFANIGNFIIIAAVCLERNLFSGIEHHLYCWHTSVAMLILHLLLTLPMAFSIKNYFIPMVKNKFIGHEWYYYWIVPAIFYLIWQYQINGGEVTGLDIMLDPSNVIFLFIINIGSFLIYLIMIKLDGQLAKNLELEERNHYLDIENLEYELLEERIQEARRARHDMRHHIILMNDYLENEEYGELKEYLKQYKQSLPDDHAIQFCPNRAVNSVLLHFAHEAREYGIDFQVNLSIPEKLTVSDTDISVLLGNLLENAVDACAECDTDRHIIVRGNAEKHSLFFTIDNSCRDNIKRDKRGEFISTKKKGSGLGLQSAKYIVTRYNGVFRAEKKENMFFVSFMLNL